MDDPKHPEQLDRQSQNPAAESPGVETEEKFSSPVEAGSNQTVDEEQHFDDSESLASVDSVANEGKPTTFDFRVPIGLAGDVGEQWLGWLDLLATDFNEKWLQLANAENRLRSKSNITLTFDAAKKRLPKPAVSYHVSLNDQPLTMLVVMERALAMAVVMQVLGEPVDEMPQDRPLSVIEHSLCEMWFSQFATSMGDSWPQKDPLIFKLGDLDLRPHRSRLHEPKESMLFATIELETGGQQRELFCLLPLSDIESLLHTTGSHGLPLSKSSEMAMQQRAHDLPVAVTVALGSAYLRVSELANLVEGDVIVLDQRISEPLPLKVAEKTKFFGWLGRKGNRQAFKVSEVA